MCFYGMKEIGVTLMALEVLRIDLGVIILEVA